MRPTIRLVVVFYIISYIIITRVTIITLLLLFCYYYYYAQSPPKWDIYFDDKPYDVVTTLFGVHVTQYHDVIGTLL